MTYFISDVHLGATSEAQERERLVHFLRFLKSIETKAAKIFFVGDLFDFWFEYKYVIPKRYFSVLHQLKLFAEKNIEMHYLTGNHDFWLGEFFTREMGITTHENYWAGEIGDKNFYLYHGDGIAKKDAGYRFLKRILRNKINIKIYRWLHPDLGIPFARLVSGSSRLYTDRRDLNDNDDYIDFAKTKFKEGYDYVLMGHKHRPREIEENGKKYINLGDWLFHFSYAVFDGEKLKLKFDKL
ncbi:UDP-2,3-diacylglucosamine diphosphatase [Calditrichota bacterium]